MFVEEALIYGLREGAKLGAVYLLWRAAFGGMRWPGMRVSMGLGMSVAFVLFAVLSIAVPGMAEKEFVYRFSGYVFFLFFFSASVVLLRFPSAGTGRQDAVPGPVAAGLMALCVVLYLSPDAIALSIFLHDLSVLKAGAYGVYLSFWAAAGAAFLLMHLAARKCAASLGALFSSSEGGGLGALLISLVLVKLLLSGLAGFNEISLLPTVQRGIMKFVHDVVHQSFLFLQVPDHPMLRTTVWNFIGLLFGPEASISLSLLLLLAPPAMYLYITLSADVQYPPEAGTAAEKRLLRARTRSERGRRIIPAAAFVLMVIASWYVSGSDKVAELYMPEPVPLVEEAGIVAIPLSSPGVDLADGRIHKFSLVLGGQSVRIMVVARPDGGLAVTLDACEICPPEGYGQRGEYVICAYCMTPIPVGTLGEQGGCNPIPLEAAVTARDVRLNVNEIASKWEKLVGAGRGGGGE